MQIQIASDLHLEHNKQAVKKDIVKKLKDGNDCKTIILAGDITSYKDIVKDLLLFKKYYDNVIYVNGNHEAWGTSLDNLNTYRNCLKEEINWLENNICDLNNIEFIGCTLWFPNGEDNSKFDWNWPDFKNVNNSHQIYERNHFSQNFLTNNINEGSVVITHHFPSEKSIHSQYKGDSYNRYFFCDMEHVIKSERPKLWIHGHSHHKFDYYLESTRIICNPLGYPGENGIGEFDWNKIIEI